MNKMQKVTAVVSLFAVAGFLLAAGTSPNDRGVLASFAAAIGLVGALLAAVFERGDAVVRLQKGMAVLSVAAAVLILAFGPLYRYIPAWRMRLAQYPELNKEAPAIGSLPNPMDAADSVIAAHLLSGQTDLWRAYGSDIVPCARRNAVTVETIISVMRRQTAVLSPSALTAESLRPDTQPLVARDVARTQRQHSNFDPALVDAARAELARRARMDQLLRPNSRQTSWKDRARVFPYFTNPESASVEFTARKYGISNDEVIHRLLLRDATVTRKAERLRLSPSTILAMTLRLDSLIQSATWNDDRTARRIDAYRPSESWHAVRDWPARLAIAAGVLLIGAAVLIVLGFFRRRTAKNRTDSATD